MTDWAVLGTLRYQPEIDVLFSLARSLHCLLAAFILLALGQSDLVLQVTNFSHCCNSQIFGTLYFLY